MRHVAGSPVPGPTSTTSSCAPAGCSSSAPSTTRADSTCASRVASSAGRTESLLVGSRDCTELVDGVLRQVEHVRDAFGVGADLPVRGFLCFLDADWPPVGGSFSTRGVGVSGGLLDRSAQPGVDPWR